VPRYHYSQPPLEGAALAGLVAPHVKKLRWFLENGYTPHYYQLLFHVLADPTTSHLCRFRQLVAGRRGGKTKSAAEEVNYYIENPADYWMDFHGLVRDEPIHAWVLSKDNVVGRAALIMFRSVLRRTGAKDRYQENRAEKYFDHSNGGLLEFKTAKDPESLRGMGLHILWLDEAAFIPTARAYEVASPGLDDNEGVVIGTTTPAGKNWYYTEFFGEAGGDLRRAPEMGSVEYRSIDNEHFKERVWQYRKRTVHPLLFKQEYEASFDSMVGKELPGLWLTEHFYERADLEDEDGKALRLRRYLGVDPAVSLNDDADHFAMMLGGVDDLGRCYLLKELKTRLPFAEQIDVVAQWHERYRPHLIGVESVAYQAVLAQQLQRLPSMPPVIPMLAVGKKAERILSMSPLFKIGRVRCSKDMHHFIDEWLNYNSTMSNPDDDLLDATEMMLRTAGALLPPADRTRWDDDTEPASDINVLVERSRRMVPNRDEYDEILGAEW
jgi:predicted phage terminase large subunit-like protein